MAIEQKSSDVYGTKEGAAGLPSVYICSSDYGMDGNSPTKSELRDDARSGIKPVFDTLVNEGNIPGYRLEEWDTDFGSQSCNLSDYNTNTTREAWTEYRENNNLKDTGCWLLVHKCGDNDNDDQAGSALGYRGSAWVEDATAWVDWEDVSDVAMDPTVDNGEEGLFQIVCAHETLHTFIHARTDEEFGAEPQVGNCQYIETKISSCDTSTDQHGLATIRDSSDLSGQRYTLMTTGGGDGTSCGQCSSDAELLTENYSTLMSTCTKDAIQFSYEHENIDTIDSFADGDMSEYTVNQVGPESGPQTTYQAFSERVHRDDSEEPSTEDGTALKLQNKAIEDSSYTTEFGDLPNLPEAGDIVPTTWWTRIGEGDGNSADAYAQTLWAWQKTDGPGGDSFGYFLGFNYNNGDPVIKLNEAAPGDISLLAETSVSASLNSWYQFELDWDSNGDMTVIMYDDSGTSSVSANDSDWTGGGIGWAIGAASSGGEEVAFFDRMVKDRRNA